jgi:hypothetical protein
MKLNQLKIHLKSLFIILSCCLIFSNYNILIAQNNSNNNNKTSNDSTKLLDLMDVAGSLFKKKSRQLTEDTKKDKKFQFSIFPIIGYSLQTGFAASISGNALFRNGTNDSTNYSAIVQTLSVTEKKQFQFYVQSEIWSENNNWNFNGDFRYYIYPQNTYGLGGFTKESDAILVNYSLLRLYGTLHKKVKQDLYLGIGYMLDKRWDINQDDHAQPNDLDYYGYTKTSTSSGVSFNVLIDKRDNPINSSKGFYANSIVRFNKLFLGSDEDWTSVTLDFRKYFKLGKKNTVLALWNYNWLTLNGHPPYFDLPSTGWNRYSNIGRGYIQSRFRSLDLVYLESELRFNITKNKFLGAVVFANAQSFTEINNKKFERVIPGFGTGLRFKFNKYSKTNLAIDYALGIDGNGGVFINLGEVF